MSHAVRPWREVVVPHEDILHGRLEMSTYAADVGAVARKDPRCPLVYRDPRTFFQATYLTRNLKALLGDVMKVWLGQPGDRVLQLRTPFGGGKTHSLVALYHLATGRAALEGLPDLWPLPDPGPVRTAVITGIDLDARQGREVAPGQRVLTMWGDMAWQLGGPETYAMVADHDRHRTAPGGELLARLLGEGPNLILLDEVLIYAASAMTVDVRDSTLGRQVLVFLQRLTEVVRRLPRTALVYSLQASAHEAAGEEGLLTDLDHLVGRVDAKREPVTDDEVMRVVQRRLFQDLGPEWAREAAANAYADLYRQFRESLAGTAAERQAAAEEAATLRERILAAYPFHPDLLDLMYHRWGTLPSYQRTRGALQFLANVVHALYAGGQHPMPLIGPGDVPLDDEGVRSAFFTQVGQREPYTAVLNADIIGTTARVREVDRRLAADSPPLAYLRPGTRLATAAMLYSFGASDEEGKERGVVEQELIAACLAPGLNRMVLATALGDLREHLLYLHYTNRRYRFETQPNLNKLIADEAKKFTQDEVLQELRSELSRRLGGRDAQDRSVLWPRDSMAIPDRQPIFRVVYLGLEWADRPEPDVRRGIRELVRYRGGTERYYRNALAFAVPAKQQADRCRQSVRQVMALRSLINQHRRLGLKPEQIEELQERLRGAQSSLAHALDELYQLVYLPVFARGPEDAFDLEVFDLSAQIGRGSIHERVVAALSNWVFDTLRPDRIVHLTRLGQGDAPFFMACVQLVDAFFSMYQFPKLWDDRPLRAAIAVGVGAGTFGYVAGAEPSADGRQLSMQPGLLRYGSNMSTDEVDLGPGTYLVAASHAAEWIRAQAEDGAGGQAITPPSTPVPGVPTGPDGRPDGAFPPTTGMGGSTGPGPATGPVRGSTGGRILHLRFSVNKVQLFQVQGMLQALSDQARELTARIEITAVAKERFDDVWLRNAVDEPLHEADAQVEEMRVTD